MTKTVFCILVLKNSFRRIRYLDITFLIQTDKPKTLQINFSAMGVDLQGFNKFLQFGYNHLIRFTLYASILKLYSRAINTC